MLFSKLVVVASAVALSTVNGLNILISNDDGFGTANIRAMYKAVKALGHNAYIVASTSNESGTGGTAVFTNQANLTADTEFGIVKKGAPSIGTDPNDSHIWYYNGTPSACVSIALSYILPNFGDFQTPDLFLSGPNYGWNLGPFLYTLSGTIGSTYTAVEYGIPGIAFSGGYSTQTPYFYTNETTSAGLADPATIMGELAANFAQSLIDQANGGRILPLGYGINVNIPVITSFTNDSCVDPPFIKTRFTGGADNDGVKYNASTGLFSYTNVVEPGANTCINGDCSLPGETQIIAKGCYSTVTLFTVDYDAPTCAGSASVSLGKLVTSINATSHPGGLNGTSANGTTASNATNTSTAIPSVTGAASTVARNGFLALFSLVIAMLVSL